MTEGYSSPFIERDEDTSWKRGEVLITMKVDSYILVLHQCFKSTFVRLVLCSRKLIKVSETLECLAAIVWRIVVWECVEYCQCTKRFLV